MIDKERQKLVVELVDMLMEADNETYNKMKSTMMEWEVVPQLRIFLKELLKYTDAERKEAGRHEEQS